MLMATFRHYPKRNWTDHWMNESITNTDGPGESWLGSGDAWSGCGCPQLLSSSGRCVEPSHCSLCCRPEIRRVEVTQVMQHWHPRTDSSSQLCSDPPMVNTSAVWALLWGISWGGTLDRYKALLSGQWRVVRTSSSGIVIGVTGINVPGVTEWSLVSHCLKSEWSLWYLGELPPCVELYFESEILAGVVQWTVVGFPKAKRSASLLLNIILSNEYFVLFQESDWSV